jgi:probable F420-dependent oxidoreductase
MKLGLFGINMGPCSTPDACARVAQAAEAAGFESVWAGEHVLLPEPQEPPSPLPPSYPMLDPNIAFAYLAGQTKTIRMGTGIIILPQRNPLVLAKEMASLDVLSNGRLIFGIGIGYLKPEFDALGIPFAKKGARTLEYLEAMQAIWSQDQPTYTGEFVSFSGVQALPRPVQKPHPPAVFGGMTSQAFQRSITHANGWYGFGLDVDGTKKCLEGLQEAQKNNERPSALGTLEISVTPSGRVDLDTAKRFADIGVDRLVLLPPTQSDKELFSLTGTEQELTDYVKHVGDTVVGYVK